MHSPAELTGRPPAAAAPARPARRWAAYAAAAWAALFCAQSIAAAVLAVAGSDAGADLFAAHFAELARERDAGFIVVLWVAALAKAAGVAIALAWTRLRDGSRPPAPLLVLTVVGGLAVAGYGAANLVEGILMRSGVLAVPASLGERALTWHLWLWNPYWILGGVLLLAVPRRSGAVTRPPGRLTRPPRRRRPGSAAPLP